MKTDGDFEDREGHQAPFTLPEEENVQSATRRIRCGERSTRLCPGRATPWRASNIQRPTKRSQDPTARLFELLDLANERFEVRPFAGVEFGVERFAIGADFEGAAARWDEGERRDPIAEFENLGRQTDGFGRVVSNAAILDPDFGFHRFPPFQGEAIGAARMGQDSGGNNNILIWFFVGQTLVQLRPIRSPVAPRGVAIV